jgi:hypothetical protein
MLGHIVVKFMRAILEIAGTFLITAGTIAGGFFASSADMNVIIGVLVGFIASFLIVVVTFGTAFLILEINNNLILIHDSLHNKS